LKKKKILKMKIFNLLMDSLKEKNMIKGLINGFIIFII
jgi:hypothetical protein